MIRLIFLFLVLGLGLYAGTEYSGEQGYVLISIADKTIEMSVTTLIIFAVVTLTVLFTIEFIIKKILRMTSDTWNWFSVRKLKRSRRMTNEGIMKLMEGDWKQAEQKVIRWAKHHDMPALCYLVASQAAQEQGNTAKRNTYLELASQQDNADLAVELTKAKQYVQLKQYDNALQSLNRVSHDYPHNPILLSLLKTIYVQLEKWESVLSLVSDLKRTKMATENELNALSEQAYCGLLSDISGQRNTEGLMDHWNDLPKKVRLSSTIRTHLVQLLLERDADKEAYQLITEHIKKDSSSKLYQQLPELNLDDNSVIISFLENSIKKNTNNADAHSALGRIYLNNKNWKKAQEELEKSLSIRSNVHDFNDLSTALEKQNKYQDAHSISKKAIALITH